MSDKWRIKGLLLGALLLSIACNGPHVLSVQLRLPSETSDAGVLADAGPVGTEAGVPTPDGGTPPGVLPPDVVSHEVRVYRLDSPDLGCPSAEAALNAERHGVLVHLQSFAATGGRGEPIGAVPPGRYAVVGLSRDVSCGVALYGCSIFEVSEESMGVVVDLAELDSTSTCGCRTCQEGACQGPLLCE